MKSITFEHLKGLLRDKEQLFASPINLWATGKTYAGKTSLGNSLLDSKIMKSEEVMDCTDFVGFFSLGTNLRYLMFPVNSLPSIEVKENISKNDTKRQYCIIYSGFWSNQLDIAVITIFGAPIEDRETVKDIIKTMSEFELIDMTRL